MSTAQVQQQPPQLHTGRDLSSSSNMSFASNDPTIGGISSSNGNTQDLFSNNPLKNSLSSNALKQLASRNAPSSPGGGGGGLSRGLESNDEAYQRAVSRIASLEATLEYQKVLHADQLKGLHEEVHRLQSICSGKKKQKTMHHLLF